MGSVTALRAATGSDGKTYEMVCLPLKYALAWLLGIDSRNVKSEAKEGLLKYQNECYDVIYDKFFLEPQRQKDKLIAINRQELEIANIKSEEKELKSKMKRALKKLEEIKQMDPTELSLFAELPSLN